MLGSNFLDWPASFAHTQRMLDFSSLPSTSRISNKSKRLMENGVGFEPSFMSRPCCNGLPFISNGFLRVSAGPRDRKRDMLNARWYDRP
jgi:hypothetical protein